MLVVSWYKAQPYRGKHKSILDMIHVGLKQFDDSGAEGSQGWE